MALNKLFIHFQTKSAFNEQKENISDTSIAFIKETGEIYTHDKLYGSISVASTTANGLMPKEHYSIIDKESNNLFVTELSNNVSTTADKVYIQYKSRYFGDDLKHNNICNILSATSTNAGVMSATDKRKLDSLSNYTLPTADSSTLGGIKIGSGLNIDSNGVVSVNNKLYILVNSLESVTTPDTNKIYLVQSTETVPDGELNVYVEWIYVNNKWEKLGEFKTAVDLTPYAKTADVTSAINAAKTELTDRFNQCDAALATHEEQIALINQGKTSWANGGTITSETYYNILKGTQDSFTLPFDLNGFVSSITAKGNAQRYSGVMIAVSYANKPGQPKQRGDTLYLPFAAVNADKGVVAFEDLQFHYTDLAGTDVDVRYKVTPASNSLIKLEKVAAELPWLDLSPADDEELKNFMNAFALAGQTGEAQEYALTAHEAVDITKYRGIVIDIASEGIHFKTPFVVSDGTYRICAETFIANSECVLACKCADSKLWLTLINISLRDMFQYQSTFAKTSDLSDYAKKTDVYTKTEIDTKLTGMVKIQKLTQEEYDALKTKDENVLYAIIEPTTAG